MSDPKLRDFEKAKRALTFLGGLIAILGMGVFFAVFSGFTLNTFWGVLAAITVWVVGFYIDSWLDRGT